MCVCSVYLCVTLFLVSVLVAMLLATPTSGKEEGDEDGKNRQKESRGNRERTEIYGREINKRERHWSKITVIANDLNFYLASQVTECCFGSLQSTTTCQRVIINHSRCVG